MVHRFASFPQAGHFVLPGSIFDQRDWSKGMASDFAPADGARSSWGSALHFDQEGKIMQRPGSDSRSATAFLDIVFACLLLAPRQHDNALVV